VAHVNVSREMFYEDRQGRTFADALHDSANPLRAVFEFFNSEDRQRGWTRLRSITTTRHWRDRTNRACDIPPMLGRDGYEQ